MTQKTCDKCGGIGLVFTGEALRNMRKNAGISLKDAAKRLRLSQAYLCDIEHNRREGNLKISTAYRKLK